MTKTPMGDPAPPSFRRRSWRAFLALAAYSIALFWINHIPRIGVSLGGGTDKYAHFGAYGLLAFLIAWAFFPERRGTPRGYAAIFVMAAAYGAMDEFLQSFVPNRSADWMDWYADLGGAALALLTHALLAPTLGRIRRWLTPQWLQGGAPVADDTDGRQDAEGSTLSSELKVEFQDACNSTAAKAS